MRLNEDSSTASNTVSKPYSARGDNSWTKGAMIANDIMVFNITTCTDEIVIANYCARTDLAVCKNDISLTQKDIHSDYYAWMNDVSERNSL